MEKLRVGVLMGGKSIEREVSFNSGRTICDHLTSRYSTVPLFQTDQGTLFLLPWHFLHRGKISDFQSRLETEAQKVQWDDIPSLVDFMYIAMHGHYAEDGTLQGVLEVLGIPYLGSGILASALGMDKIKQKQILHAANITTPKGIVVSVTQIEQLETHCNLISAELANNGIHFPYIVKPSAEGSSFGVSVVFNNDDLLPALQHASAINPHKKQPVIIEEKIEGMEFSCVILTDYKTGMPIALPPTEIIPKEHIFDYDQKYMPGHAHEYTPARTSQDYLTLIQNTCVATMRALNFTNLARVDGFLTKNNTVVIIDPNSLSGMAPATFLFRQAAEINMSHTHVINHLIETELEHYGMLQPLLQQEKKESNMNKKLRVGVLFGGRSNEKEISLESGRNVCYKLSPQKYDVTPLFVNHNLHLFAINQRLLVRNSTQEIELLLEPSMQITWHQLAAQFDFIFIGLHGGEGENGAVQGMLEMIGIAYNGSGVLTSALCMDKYKTNEFLKTNGFDVPLSYLVTKNEWETDPSAIKDAIASQFSRNSLIVKPHDDGCSVMVQKVSSDNWTIDDAIDRLFSQSKEYALVEECITGMELTVGIIGNETPCALPPSQAISKSEILSIKEKFLPGAGENQTPAPLDHDEIVFVQKTVEKVYKTVNAKGYARIDCFYQNEKESPTGTARVVIIEINTMPGLTPATCIFHQAAEMKLKPMDFIDRIVELGLEEHNAMDVTKLEKEMAVQQE